jgi:hypothetical protein
MGRSRHVHGRSGFVARGSVALLAVVMVVAAGCGATNPTASEAGVTATSATRSDAPAGSASGVGDLATLDAWGSLVPAADQTLVGAADAELAFRRWLRDETDIAGALGENGAEFVSSIEALEISIGEKRLKTFVDDHAIDLGASAVGDTRIASVDPSLPAPRPANDADGAAWSGSLIGETSIAVSIFLSMAPQLFPQATGPTFQSETKSESKSYDHESGGIKEHLTVDERLTVGAGGGRVLLEDLVTSTSVLTRISTGEVVGRRVSTSTGRFDMQGCPAADGTARGDYTITFGDEISPASGSARGGASGTSGSFTAHDGDDAHLIQTEFLAQVAANGHGPGRSTDGDWSVGATYPLTIPASGGVTAITLGTASQPNANNATDAQWRSLAWPLVMASNAVGDAAKQAEKFWRSGACIELKTSQESRKVPANEPLTIDVDAVHRFDGAMVPAKIKASFSGKDRVDPADRPQAPPATFQFKAGATKGDTGTIDLEQVGVRGIAKKTLKFTVQSALSIALDGEWRPLPPNVVHFLVPKTELARQDDGSFQAEVSASVTGKVGFPGCTKPFSDTLPLRITVRLADADPKRAQVRLDLTSGTGLFSATITCHGATTRAPVPANLWVTSFIGASGQGVDVTIGKPTTVTGSGGSAGSSTVVTLTTDD